MKTSKIERAVIVLAALYFLGHIVVAVIKNNL